MAIVRESGFVAGYRGYNRWQRPTREHAQAKVKKQSDNDRDG